jgi:hypothetical protein
MLNLIDLVLAAFVLFFLLKNAGGIVKTVKNILFILLILILFGAFSRLLLNSAFISGEARRTLESAYFVKMSLAVIGWAYPSIETGAPKVDSFIKDNIIEGKNGEKLVTTPEGTDLVHPEKFIPNYKPLKLKSDQ